MDQKYKNYNPVFAATYKPEFLDRFLVQKKNSVLN